MQIEHEIKILDINDSEIFKLLSAHGYTQSNTQNFRRYVFESPLNDTVWIRLRTDGVKTTLAIKQYVADTIDGVNEEEVLVDDFEKTKKILLLQGMRQVNYQENRRVNFVCDSRDGLEISIDYWPGIPPYMEIEGRSTRAVEQFLEKIKLSNRTTSAPTSKVYERYGIDITNRLVLKFNDFA